LTGLTITSRQPTPATNPCTTLTTEEIQTDIDNRNHYIGNQEKQLAHDKDVLSKLEAELKQAQEQPPKGFWVNETERGARSLFGSKKEAIDFTLGSDVDYKSLAVLYVRQMTKETARELMKEETANIRHACMTAFYRAGLIIEEGGA